MKREREYRAVSLAELRAEANGSRSISGYAAVFNSPSDDLGGFTEVVIPGAFRRALVERQDVRMLVNHDANRVLGRISAGTLTLQEDSKGLHFRCNMPDTEYARDLMALITRGDVRECSFGFIAKADRWNRARDRRELLDVNLMDTSVVTYPAYPATAVAARSREIHGEKREVGWYRSAVLTPNDIPYRGHVAEEEQRLRDYLRLAKIKLEVI